MKETDMEAIDVDELMEKIKTEVKRRKMQGGEAGDVSSDPCHVGDFAPDTARESAPLEYKEDGYLIDDFMKYHDEDFMTKAYQGILMRSADPSAFEYFLSNLRSGKMTKAEVLGRLRYTPEGRVRHVRIQGLFWNFFIQSSFRMPVFGYFMRLMTAILNLPKIVRNLQTMEGSAFTQLKNQRDGLCGVSDTFQAKMGTFQSEMDDFQSRMDDVATRYGDVVTALGRKADMAEVSGLLQQKADTHEVIDRLKHKADLWVVEALKERKADHDALEEVAAQKADREELAELNEKKVGREELVAVSEAKADVKDLIAMGETIGGQIQSILGQIKDHKLNVVDQDRRLRLLLEEARKRLPEALSTEQIQKMVAEEDHILNAVYVGFEDKFRGTREDIKGRQKIYLPFLRAARAGTRRRPVLDVGCGRGEWLELLKEHQLAAMGVDANQVMQRMCEDLGLQVEMGDAVEFLIDQKPNTLGAVTGFHIVEHLPTGKMVALFDEALRVLKPGGIVIFETPNPENILVGSCTFYTDPTHKRPIPPDTLLYLIENRGFVGPEIVRSSPLNYAPYSGEDALKHIFHRFNMEQDYAVIARKPS